MIAALPTPVTTHWPASSPRAARCAPSLALAVALAAVASGGCAAASDPEVSGDGAVAVGVPAEIVVEGMQVLISDDTTDLSIPAAIDVDGDGNVWITDRRLHHVLVVSPDGELLRTIGRRGGGPGEFRGPRGVGIRGDHAYVLDNVHGVQAFDMEGNYVFEYPAVRILFDFDFSADGGLMVSNNRVWARGSLISSIAPDGEGRALFGELPYPNMEGFNFGAMREAILAGTIPDELRNAALPVVAPDGSLWVVLPTELILRRYAAEDLLLAESTFELPEFEAIRAQYFEDFAGAPFADSFFFPSFAAAGFATAEHLLLLWETVEGTPGLITVHDRSGAVVQRLVLPELDMGGGGFSIMTMTLDVTRRRLYIGISDIATIFAIDLPEQAVAF